MFSLAVGKEHVPLAGSQVPAPWHSSGAGHALGALPTHLPALHDHDRQWSVCVAEQSVPSAFAIGAEHVPLAGSHVPGSWQRSVGAGHVFGFEPLQPPAWHVYVCKHLSGPEHGVPVSGVGLPQTPVL